MPDINKVIKGLEQCGMSSECIGRDCPYWHDVLDDAVKACNCTTELVRDALTLLKEHPQIVRCKDCEWYDEQISMCNNCGLPREQTFFCADGKRR